MTYSSSVSISRRQSVRRHQNVVSFANPAQRLGPVSNTLILIVLACLVGLLYLTQVTKTNSYGYRINELQGRYQLLKEQKTDLQISAARLQSLERVSNSQPSQKLVSAAPSATLQ